MNVSFKNNFWLNLLVALVAIGLLVILFFNSLGSITHHNENIKVPKVEGSNVDSAAAVLAELGFGVEVLDSIYVDSLPPLIVTRQSPEPDAEVKDGRVIYLTINRALAPLVDMPDLRGFSYKSAELYLKTLNLKMGDTIYKPDIAKNFVLDQQINGKQIKPGTKVNMGTAIDFVLGSGIGATAVPVPDLFGMTVKEARAFLEPMHINIGAVASVPDVTDEENAFIYEQSPPPYAELIPGQKVQNKIRPGQYIDLKIQSAKPDRPEPDMPVITDSVSANPPSIGN